jgi:hypothetical protein
MSPKRFIVHCPTTDLPTFKAVARETLRLQPYGDVLVNISELAAKATHEIPDGGSAWHEYAVHSPALHRVFPHPAMTPYVPADFVRRNQELLLAKADILARLGLGSAFWSVEPCYLPEGFFQAHPHLRGPRVDHPRRTRREEFALCLDLPESQDMAASMMAELRRRVPHLGAFAFKTNDAGAGLCWGAALYPGVLGPAHCRGLSPGQHVANLVAALHKGAAAGGGDVPVFIGHSNFWNNEIYDIVRLLPANTFLADRHVAAAAATVATGSLLGSCSPARGLFDPLAILEAAEQVRHAETRTVFVDFRMSYDRAGETPDTVGRVVEALIHGLEHPASTVYGQLQSLRAWAASWAGESAADAVWQGCYDLHAALRIRSAAIPRGFSPPLYASVSLRHLTRPMVFDPARLSPEEEGYFLPYVFNVDLTEARQDWIDLHGSRLEGPSLAAGSVPGLAEVTRLLRRSADAFESVAGPAATTLGNLGPACRVLASAMRSAGNFYFGQLIRDRHADRVTAGPDIAKRLPGGTADLLRWYELTRDEMENAEELAALFASRGMEAVVHATKPADEDTFRLGPNLIADLRRKAALMRAHWCDAEQYLQSPNK